MKLQQFSVFPRITCISSIALWTGGWVLLTLKLVFSPPLLNGIGVPLLDWGLRLLVFFVLGIAGPLGVFHFSYRIDVSADAVIVRRRFYSSPVSYRLSELKSFQREFSRIHGYHVLRLDFIDGRSQMCGALDRNYERLTMLLAELFPEKRPRAPELEQRVG